MVSTSPAGSLARRNRAFGDVRERTVVFAGGLDGGDLAFGARDGFRHLHEIVAEAVDRLVGMFPTQCRFDAIDRGEHQFRIGVAISAAVLAQKPAATHGFHDRGADGVVVLLARGRQCGPGLTRRRGGKRLVGHDQTTTTTARAFRSNRIRSHNPEAALILRFSAPTEGNKLHNLHLPDFVVCVGANVCSTH